MDEFEATNAKSSKASHEVAFLEDFGQVQSERGMPSSIAGLKRAKEA